MFNSTVLEVAIGMVFCFGSVALITSSLNEALASLLKLRASTLLNGVKALLNDSQFNGLALSMYNHALVHPRGNGTATGSGDLQNCPSYIDANHFAQALIDTLQTVPGNFTQLGRDIDNIPNAQLRQALQGMYQRANGDVQRLQEQVSSWFDSAMERVSGAYRRQTQLICFTLALLLAIALNIDCFHLFKALWLHPALIAQLELPDGSQAGAAYDSLQQLPIGWQEQPSTCGAWLIMFGGWLVTATSALFGAPFWFHLLQRLLPLRTAPATNTPAG